MEENVTIALFAKHRPFADAVEALLKQHFQQVDVYTGDRSDPFPIDTNQIPAYDYLISYISPWIIPGAVLRRARIAAVNFHPGPPEYPGIGCTNFALYNGETTYGVTAHYMTEKVDSGEIILVKRFPIFPEDTVHSLTIRAYAYLYITFVELFPYILQAKKFPISGEKWKRKPYTRKELNELCRLDPSMPPEEIRRRVRALDFPGAPGAYLELAGIRFVPENDRKQ